MSEEAQQFLLDHPKNTRRNYYESDIVFWDAQITKEYCDNKSYDGCEMWYNEWQQSMKKYGV